MAENRRSAVAPRALLAAALCVACAVLTQSAGAPKDPFTWSRTTFPQTDFGLDAGCAAPVLADLVWIGHPSVVVATPRGSGLVLPPAAREWSTLADLQVVVLDPSSTAPDARAWLRDHYGNRVTLVTGGAAVSALRGFAVGAQAACRVVFLVDADGRVAYRVWNPSERHIAELDRVVRAFAEAGTIPNDAVSGRRLAEGDLVPAAPFSLETPSGSELVLPPDTPRLIFCGSPLADGLSADVRREVGQLQAEFPEVEFLWVTPYVSLEACRAIWEIGQRLGWNAWGQLSLPLDAYLQACTESETALRAALAELAAGDACGWRVALDRDYRLQRSWALVGAPSVCVLGRSGHVAFPCTFYVANRASGASVFPDGALDALRAVLKGVTS